MLNFVHFNSMKGMEILSHTLPRSSHTALKRVKGLDNDCSIQWKYGSQEHIDQNRRYLVPSSPRLYDLRQVLDLNRCRLYTLTGQEFVKNIFKCYS